MQLRSDKERVFDDFYATVSVDKRQVEPDVTVLPIWF
jgi:hypothetical protein